jgi:signal transduction histidine kinase
MVLTAAGFYLIVASRAHSFHLINLLGLAILFVLIAGLILSHYIRPFKNWKVFDSGQLGPLLIFNVATIVMFLGYIPLFSPFLITMAATMFVTIYYRGYTAYVISILIVVGLVITYTVIHGTPHVANGDLYPIATILLAISFGGTIVRAGIIDNSVRNEFIRVSEAIEFEREQLSSLIDSLTVAVIAADRAGNILFYNNTAKKYLVPRDPNTPNKPKMVNIFNEKNSILNIIQLAEGQKNEKIQIKDVHILSKEHKKLNLNIDVSPIKSKNTDDQAGFIVIIRDVTKEKSLEQERDEFIAVISSEIRSPIAGTEGALSLLLNPKLTQGLDSKVIDRLNYAYQSIEYLSNLTNQISILSQAEQDLIKISFENFDINKMVNELKHYFEPRAKEKRLSLNLRVSLGISEIRSNKVYVNEILKNFLSNAIKFTNSGSVSFEVAKASKEDEIIFKVQDTGVGIDTTDQDNIFLKYFKVEDFNSKDTSGTGLGLYLSAKLAGYIDGKIWCQSELNKGSTFFLKIPNIKEPGQNITENSLPEKAVNVD